MFVIIAIVVLIVKAEFQKPLAGFQLTMQPWIMLSFQPFCLCLSASMCMRYRALQHRSVPLRVPTVTEV